VGGNTVTMTYGKTDPNGNPEITKYQTGSTTAHIYSDPVTGQPLLLTSSTGANSMYVYDGLGNPTAIVADNNTNTGYVGYTYDPFAVDYSYGNPGGTLDTQNPYTYKGGIVDKTSYLVHFGNRFYNQYYGTWTQQDTLDAPLDPSNANRYAYAGDDPINGQDPSGGSEVSDYLGSCAQGAATGLLIGAIDGTDFTGAGAVANAGLGCGEGLAATAVDKITRTEL